MTGTSSSISLQDKFAQFSEQWSRKKIAALNDYDIKVQGEFAWHSRHDTDEMFLVVAGRTSHSASRR